MTRARALPAALLLLCVGFASACGTDGESGEGTSAAPEELRVIIPSSPGGGLDQYARVVQPSLNKAFGFNVEVENIEAGSGAVGLQELLSDGGDCTSIMFMQVPAFNYILENPDAGGELGDFTAMVKFVEEGGLIRVRNDAPWETFDDFIGDAKARPGEIAVSISNINSNNNSALLDLEKATGADFNIVPFDGGGPSRTALIGGQVDATHSGIFNSLSIDAETRVLAVQGGSNDHPELTDEAPTMSEALGVDVPATTSNYGFFSSAECANDNPEQFSAIVDLLIQASEDDELTERTDPLDLTGALAIVGPEEYAAEVEEAQQAVDRTAGN